VGGRIVRRGRDVRVAGLRATSRRHHMNGRRYTGEHLHLTAQIEHGASSHGRRRRARDMVHRTLLRRPPPPRRKEREGDAAPCASSPLRHVPPGRRLACRLAAASRAAWPPPCTSPGCQLVAPLSVSTAPRRNGEGEGQRAVACALSLTELVVGGSRGCRVGIGFQPGANFVLAGRSSSVHFNPTADVAAETLLCSDA
jgi:hypothetical protein